MKFTAINISGLKSYTFPVIGASASVPYFVKSVDGLGPPDQNVVISNQNRFGGYYHNTIPQLRQIVLRLGINMHPSIGKSVEQLRSELYAMMESKATSGQRINIMNGTSNVAWTIGHVSRMEANPFSKDPEVVVTFNCTEATLSFAAYNTVASTNNFLALTTPGTARSSVMIEAVLLKPTNSFGARRYLAGITGYQEFLALSGFPYQINDVIRIVTDNGDKRVTLNRGGIDYNHMGYLAPGSTWPMLDPFIQNTIECWGPGTPTIPGDCIISVTYWPRYWGV